MTFQETTHTPQLGNLHVDDYYFYLQARSGISYRSLLSQVPDSRYLRATRQWQGPLWALPKLIKHRLFSEALINYQPSLAVVLDRCQAVIRSIEEAQRYIHSNPFAVKEQHIKLSRPRVVLRLQKNLLISCSSSDLATRQIVTESGYVTAHRDELGTVHPLRLGGLLKYLRNKQISFAVEEACSAALKSGKSLRERYEHSNWAAAADLEKGLLTPFICLSQSSQLAIRGANSVDLTTLFPEIEHRDQRHRLAQKLSIAEALKCLWSARCAGLAVWVATELIPAIESAREVSSLAEELIFVVHAQQHHWCVSADRSPAVLLVGLDQKDYKDVPGILRATHYRPLLSVDTEVTILTLSQQHLASSMLKLSELVGAIPQTKAFEELQAHYARRVLLRKERDEFNSLRDFDPQLANTELQSALFPHQRVAVAWALKRPQVFIGDDMGLGKTLSVLATIDELLTQGELQSALIVCPNSLLLNWEREATHWIPHRATKALSKGNQRNAELTLFNEGRIEILVLNYEAIRIKRIQSQLSEILARRRTLLCLDESQRVKNSASKTFEAIKSIAELCSRRILLSGTPTPKDISDIWAQMFILDGGERLGTNYYSWLESVAELGNEFSKVAVKRFLPHKVNEVQGQVRELLLRRRKEHVLALPEKTFVSRDVPLTGAQEQRYEEIREELRLRLTSKQGREYTRDINNLLEQYLRAVQIASNPRLVDPNWSGTPAKFKELDNLVAEIVEGQDQKVVIWTNYLLNTRELAIRYQNFGARILSGQIKPKDRHAIVQDFQENPDNCKVLIAVPAAAGVGLTLTAAQTAIYLDKTWNAEHWLQSIDRIHRIGQAGTVTIVSLHSSKVDVLISSNLQRKCQQQLKLLDGKNVWQLPSREELLAAVLK